MADDAGWLVWSGSWVYPVALERRKSISGLLRDFEAAGDLRIVAPGRDLAEIGELVRAVYDTGRMWKVGIDSAGIGQDLAAAVEAYGVPRDAVLSMPQGFKLLPAWTSMERRLSEGKLWHCGQTCLSWAVGNCMKSERGLVTKAVAGIGKIDPAVAMANAAMLVLDAPPPLDIDAMISP